MALYMIDLRACAPWSGHQISVLVFATVVCVLKLFCKNVGSRDQEKETPHKTIRCSKGDLDLMRILHGCLNKALSFTSIHTWLVQILAYYCYLFVICCFARVVCSHLFFPKGIDSVHQEQIKWRFDNGNSWINNGTKIGLKFLVYKQITANEWKIWRPVMWSHIIKGDTRNRSVVQAGGIYILMWIDIRYSNWTTCTSTNFYRYKLKHCSTTHFDVSSSIHFF